MRIHGGRAGRVCMLLLLATMMACNEADARNLSRKDHAPPTITTFSVPSLSNSLTVSGIVLSGSDNRGVTGYLIKENATQPSVSDAGWRNSAPTSFVFTSPGPKMLYAWLKDGAGNVSGYQSANVTVTIVQPTPTPSQAPAPIATITPVVPSDLTARYPLEITQPRPGLTIANRFYKAYPGLEYNVRLAVIGGRFPYVYSLESAPSGMLIDSSKGVLRWPGPIAAPEPYAVTARVVDSEGSIQRVSWTITVTTTGFLFVDSINGRPSRLNGGAGDGTIGNPFKSLKDIYEGDTYTSKYAKSYAGYFVYWRGGTYFLDGFRDPNHLGDMEMDQTPFITNFKPLVWLAYPGEVPVFDFQGTSNHLFFEGNGPYTLYVDGLEFQNMLGKTLEAPSSAVPVFRRLKLHDHRVSSGSFNQSFLMLSRSAMTADTVIQDCTFYGMDHGAAIKVYRTSKMLIEDNVIHDFTDSTGGSLEGIALKWDIQRATVRGNVIYNVPNHAIGGNQASDMVTTGDNEILHNFVQSPGSYSIWLNQDGVGGVFHVYRNTVTGKIRITSTSSTNVAPKGNGPFYLHQNVVISNDGGVYAVGTNNNPAAVISGENLTGTPAQNLIDGNGLLLPAFQQYVGTLGWQ